ncbi:MAG: hypothetical protein EOP11_14485 [Proteobacteria bacterium]|nr:MAG: hypothetical protein EOP11_14485 [Pseudomonadota bacterium]
MRFNLFFAAVAALSFYSCATTPAIKSSTLSALEKCQGPGISDCYLEASDRELKAGPHSFYAGVSRQAVHVALVMEELEQALQEGKLSRDEVGYQSLARLLKSYTYARGWWLHSVRPSVLSGIPSPKGDADDDRAAKKICEEIKVGGLKTMYLIDKARRRPASSTRDTELFKRFEDLGDCGAR